METKTTTGSQRLVAIAEFNTLPEALAAKGFLEENGVQVSIPHYHGTSSMNAMMRVGIPLHIAEADSRRAERLLASSAVELPRSESEQANINLHTRRLWDWVGVFKIGCIILLAIAFAASVANNTTPPWWPF